MARDELLAREQAWVADVAAAQSSWETPRPLLEAILGRAIGRSADAWERIHGGQSNETYDCAVGDERFVVRAAHTARPRFTQERWAVEACRARGVPVPEILLVAHEEVGGEPVSFSVERHLSGVPLSKLSRQRGRDDRLVAKVLRNAGSVLAAIHSIETQGFGPVDAEGRGPLPDWPAFLGRGVDVRSGAPPEVLRALAALEASRPLLAGVCPRLLHFDFEPTHLLADEGTGEITGVLDLEEATSGDPAYEFARWDILHDAYAPVGPLYEGYAERAVPDPLFARRRLLGEIHCRAYELTHGDVPPAFVDAARGRLAAALNALEA